MNEWVKLFWVSCIIFSLLSIICRNLQKDIDRMVSERQQLVSIQEQVSLERDQALRQCEELMSQSQSVSNEQTQMSKQRSDLLMERDQARAELRENTVFLEQARPAKYI